MMGSPKFTPALEHLAENKMAVQKLMSEKLENETSDHVNYSETELSISMKIGSKMVLIFRNHWHSCKLAFAKLRNLCSTFIAATCLILLVLSLLAIAFKPANKTVHVLLIDTDAYPLFTTDDKFLSVALDSSIIAEDFKHFNMTNPKLIKLMSALSPGYLRIGGTMADRLWFVPDGPLIFKSYLSSALNGQGCAYDGTNCNNCVRPNFTMSGSEWLSLNKLAAKAGLTILFDLNCLTRNTDGSWNSTNSEALIAFSHEHNLNVIWELGNEPNSFQRVFNYVVNASELANNFIKLRNILNQYPLYKKSYLVGPDTTRPHPNTQKPVVYLKNFLQKAGKYINAITWHQYYLDGRTATYIDFLNPNVLDLLKYQIATIYEAIRNVGVNTTNIWLGETSSAYGGGAPGYSDRFIATFMWLDKLGVAAQHGLDVVIRQSLFKGHYALINEDLTPAPDWWISVIYKRLVGPKVIPCYSTSSSLVRLYCHCSGNETFTVINPSITVFGINMKNSPIRIRLEGLLPVIERPYSQKVLAYILTTTLNLLSKIVILNDEVLTLLPNGDVPMFKPKVVESYPYLIMPPYSLVFWVVSSPTLQYCQQSFDW